jgi:uncharacterized protein (TIGR02118 family)
MIRVSVLYPQQNGLRFDMAYYLGKHIPMVKQKLGAPCRRVGVEAGLGGADPGSKPAFVAVATLDFDSVEAFQSALAPVAKDILGDIPNYTNAQPIIQVSEVKL